MLIVSDTVKESYNKYKTQRKSYIQVGDDYFFIQNLDIQADVYNDGNVVGNAIAKIVKFDIETEKVKKIDEFELFDGVWTGNQYEYISLGTFKLFDEKGTDDFFSSITAYDKLINFNKIYIPALVSFPITLYEFLKAICLQAGVELENSSIPNGDKILNENLFVEEETLKLILNSICQISGNFAIISNNKLKLLLKGEEKITLSKSQISSPEFKRTTWKVNQLVLGMSDIDGEYSIREDKEDIEINGVHKLVINDNPFVYSQDLREEYIDELFNQVKGFGYEAFYTNWEGLSYVELGDILEIDGHESIVLRYNIKSPNGLESTLEAPSIIDSVVTYVDNSNSIKNKQKRTEILLDKQNQKITAMSKTQDEHSTTISKIEITTEEISSSVSGISNSLNNDYTPNEELEQKLEEQKNNITNEMTTQLNQTISNFSFEIMNEINQNGVTTVKNTMVTIDQKGINIAKNNEDVVSLLDNKGVYVSDGILKEDESNVLMKTDRDGAFLKQLILSEQ